MDKNRLEPGRELDALVWQVLNGREPNIVMCRWIDGEYQPHAGYPVGHISPPHYSMDVAIAVEAIIDFLELVANLKGEIVDLKSELEMAQMDLDDSWIGTGE